MSPKIAVPKKFTEPLKSSSEIAPFLVKLQARDWTSVPTFVSPLAVTSKEKVNPVW